MSIGVGDQIPEGGFKRLTASGIEDVSTKELFAGKKVVLFAVPGAFTPTCSDVHLPGFIDRAAELRAKGVDTVACVSVNDPFVMSAWGRARSIPDAILLLADGNGDFAKAMGLVLDASGFGMGIRSRRYALIADDGKITYLGVEPDREVGVSSADAVLDEL
ncbi:MAG TPA: peroxiredoxin [Thermoanaerobaculia bacterium]|nr:peroxiredoxin [Thermoanaerobaculia bacterium]